jgi:hypothetical protein
LILDRDEADPKWILATIAISGDVRPAVVDALGRFHEWPATVQWVREMVGHDVELAPMDASAWRIHQPWPQP